jgi:hypothetical protein
MSTMVATNNNISTSTDAVSSKAQQQLWHIIKNGRQFLETLEEYAIANFPIINEEEEEEEKEGGKEEEDDDEVTDGRHPDKAPENTAAPPAASSMSDARSENENVAAASERHRDELVEVEVEVAANDDDEYEEKNEQRKDGATVISSSRKRQRVDAAPSSHRGIPVGDRPPTIETAATKPGGPPSNNNYYSKAIVKFCARTGRRLGRFENPQAAAKAIAQANPGVKARSAYTSITRVLHGEYPKWKDFFFRYEDDTTTPMPSFPIPQQRKSRLIIAYNKSGTSEMAIRGRYPTLSAAANVLAADWPGVDIDLIKRGIERALQAVGGDGDDRPEYLDYIFRYAEDRQHCNTNSTHVLQFCAQTGRRLARFANSHAAAKAIAQVTPGVKSQSASISITRVLHGEYPKWKNLYFRYEDDTTTPMPSFPINQRKRRASSMNNIKMAASEYNNDKAPTQTRALTRPPPTRPIIAYNKSGTSEMMTRGPYPTLSAAASALAAEWPGVDIDLIERGIERALQAAGGDQPEYLHYIFRYAEGHEEGKTDNGNINVPDLSSNETKEDATAAATTTTSTTAIRVPTGSNEVDATKNAPKLSRTKDASTGSASGNASDQEARSRPEGDPDLPSADTMTPESPEDDSPMDRNVATI